MVFSSIFFPYQFFLFEKMSFPSFDLVGGGGAMEKGKGGFFFFSFFGGGGGVRGVGRGMKSVRLRETEERGGGVCYTPLPA